jgi:hypothetical protein
MHSWRLHDFCSSTMHAICTYQNQPGQPTLLRRATAKSLSPSSVSNFQTYSSPFNSAFCACNEAIGVAARMRARWIPRRAASPSTTAFQMALATKAPKVDAIHDKYHARAAVCMWVLLRRGASIERGVFVYFKPTVCLLRQQWYVLQAEDPFDSDY